MKKILFALVAIMGIVACEQPQEEPTVKDTLNLAADKAEIDADGTDTVTFTVKDASNAGNGTGRVFCSFGVSAGDF